MSRPHDVRIWLHSFGARKAPGCLCRYASTGQHACSGGPQCSHAIRRWIVGPLCPILTTALREARTAAQGSKAVVYTEWLGSAKTGPSAAPLRFPLSGHSPVMWEQKCERQAYPPQGRCPSRIRHVSIHRELEVYRREAYFLGSSDARPERHSPHIFA